MLKSLTHPDEIEQIAVLRARFAVDWLHRGGKGALLVGAQLGNLAAFGFDRAARVLLLADVKLALEDDGILHRGLHGSLEIVGPAIEGGAVHEDRPRDVKVVR